MFPTLEHCVETLSRNEFWSSVSQYVERGLADKDLEAKIELLKAFLESADFRRLRSQSEKCLVEGQKVKFVVCWRRGQPDCRMELVEGA